VKPDRKEKELSEIEDPPRNVVAARPKASGRGPRIADTKAEARKPATTGVAKAVPGEAAAGESEYSYEYTDEEEEEEEDDA